MKKEIISTFLFISILFLACSNNSSGDTLKDNQLTISNKNTLKRYNVQSGIVKYKITTKGKVMGTEITGNGTKELYFKDWGAEELQKEDSKQVTKINILGHKKTEVQETHTMNKLDNGKSYTVDTGNKVIYVRRDPAMGMVKMFNKGDAEEVGKKMLESIGGKKIGTEKVLGYTCEVWQIPGGKQWIYKGVPLKIDMDVMGVHTVQEPVKAEFNIKVSDKYFDLPDYPVKETEDMMSDEEYEGEQAEMKENLKKIKKMSYKEYKKMLLEDDPEASQMSEQEIKASYEMMKKMANAIGD